MKVVVKSLCGKQVILDFSLWRVLTALNARAVKNAKEALERGLDKIELDVINLGDNCGCFEKYPFDSQKPSQRARDASLAMGLCISSDITYG